MVRFLAKLVEKLTRLLSFSGRVQESLPRFLTRLDGFSPGQYLKFDIFWLKWTYLKNLFLQSSSFYSNWILRNKKSDDFQNFWSWWCLSLDGSLGRLGGNLGSLETKCSDLDGFQDFTYWFWGDWPDSFLLVTYTFKVLGVIIFGALRAPMGENSRGGGIRPPLPKISWFRPCLK